ncbi:MAG TPA: response regulator [Gemmatimonadales bacterium]|jgi:two-component system KDP operon response regulator KdpE|nr:response regulator [Gemmatimonadales bacterium]
MATGALILVIDDELPMRRFLRAMLRANGYQVVEAATAREGLAHAAGRNPELILLDLGLPDADGVDVARTLRRSTRAPIIVLSARGREHDKVAALDEGADDYLTKPFGAPELLARIRVALRRAAAPEDGLVIRGFTSGELNVDLARREVLRGDERVHLTPTEYKLLAALIRNAGKVVTHRQLLHDVWGANCEGQTHYLRVYMGQLRHKLERDPTRPRLLTTEPGVGYRLRDD